MFNGASSRTPYLFSGFRPSWRHGLERAVGTIRRRAGVDCGDSRTSPMISCCTGAAVALARWGAANLGRCWRRSPMRWRSSWASPGGTANSCKPVAKPQGGGRRTGSLGARAIWLLPRSTASACSRDTRKPEARCAAPAFPPAGMPEGHAGLPRTAWPPPFRSLEQLPQDSKRRAKPTKVRPGKEGLARLGFLLGPRHLGYRKPDLRAGLLPWQGSALVS